jgi:predicted Zn-dependent protease
VSRGQSDAAIGLLEGLLKRTPEYQAGYVTLAKIYVSVGRTKDGIGVVERLLQRNPTHPAALELLKKWKEIDFSLTVGGDFR